MVNTLLATPAAPRVNGAADKTAGAGVWDTRVRLRWDAPGGDTAATLIGRGGKGSVVPAGGGGVGAVTDKAAAKILEQVGREHEQRGGASGGEERNAR